MPNEHTIGLRERRVPLIAMLLPLMLSLLAPATLIAPVGAQDSEPGYAPEDIWSDEYAFQIFPWGPHGDIDKLQFREYYDYFSMKERMQTLAAYYPDFLQFHEGLLGGMNARGQMTTSNDYEGWYYNHPSPWMKITSNVRGGEYNDFNGDDGNYADRPDVMLVGNHHAREWMSVQVPMFFLGVDEDFSEQFITDMVNTREIYLIPMLNTDGHRYDMEEYCGETAWENCYRSGWRKNLRDNTHTGVTPIPDVDESVDSSCDGVDLNRNYQFEWGAPLGATGPLFPGFCYSSGPNNDVYNGPVNYEDNDGDGLINEDHVDGKDDDADGQVDEDWLGGNSEPETKFIQDMTEMNDDDMNGASDFKSTLTWHSFSELVLWPWGHCTDCYTPDDEYLVYHGQMMGQMTDYAAMQSSDLYPTTGDFCDWHYGVHNSYCYTMEIGNAFHEYPEDIAHISVRNLGVPFYMVEMADDPRYRAIVGIQNTTATQHLQQPADVQVPTSGDIPIGLCLDPTFPFTPDINKSHLMWRFVEPTRQQNDFGPTEWVEVPWKMSAFRETMEQCDLLDGSNGTRLVGDIPLPDTSVGKIQYKAMLGTANGAFPFSYPTVEEGGNYYELSIPYRAAFGDAILSILMFLVIATMVWGGLGFTLREMFSEDDRILGMPEEIEPQPITILEKGK